VKFTSLGFPLRFMTFLYVRYILLCRSSISGVGLFYSFRSELAKSYGIPLLHWDRVSVRVTQKCDPEMLVLNRPNKSFKTYQDPQTNITPLNLS